MEISGSITGRFLSADPYISEPGNTQNYNRYSYAYNNPLSHTDPSGFFVCSYRQEAPYDPGQFIIVPGPCLEEVVVTATYDLEGVVVTATPLQPSSLTEWANVGLNTAGNISSGFVPVAGGNDGGPVGEPQEKNPCSATPAAAKEPSVLGFIQEEGLNILARTANVVGGAGQVLGGLGACSTIAGCIGGGPMIALGVGNIVEGFTGGPGYIRSAATSAFGNTAGNLLVDATNITTSGYGLIAKVPSVDSWKLFRNISSDFVPAYKNMTNTGLAVNVGSSALSAAGTACTYY